MSEASEAERQPQSSRPNARCPFCGATDAEPIALFGSQLLTEQWYCHACRTPFERVKDDADDSPDTSSPPLNSEGKPVEP